MLWKALVTAVLFTISLPAFADEKGDALVQGWLALIPDLLPITAETTTTYKIGKWTAISKRKVTLDHDYSGSSSGLYQLDDEYPMGLFNDPLGDNFNPLPDHSGLERLHLTPTDKLSLTKYLGKETVNGTIYDVVEVCENENLIIGPPRLMLVLERKEDNRICIKWYLDAEGVVRRMTFAAEGQLPNPYVSFGSSFDAPASVAPLKPPANTVTPLAAQPHTTEMFTATMVVDSLRKTRNPPVRAGLSDPLFTVPDSSQSNCVFSPDGKLLAIGRQDKLQVIQTSTGLPKYRVDNFTGTGRLDFSLDGKSLAFADAAGIKVIRAEDGTLIKSIAMAHRYVHSIRLSPDGKRISLIPERYEIEIWNVETGLLERTLKDSGRAYEAMFSADGKRLVALGFNTDIRIWDTSSWKTVGRLPFRTLSGGSLALSRNGKYIAAVDKDNLVLVWVVLGSAPAKKLKGAVGRIRSLTFSIDSKSLYAGDSDELSDLPTGAPGYISWDIESGSITADRSPWRKKIMSGMDLGVVSPDGRLAAFSGSPSASGVVAVFSLEAGK